MSGKERIGSDREPIAPLELLAAGVGLILTVGILGVVGWQASVEPGGRLPEIVVEPRGETSPGPVYVVPIVSRNRSPATAANVVVEGTLLDEGAVVERAETTFDYVPGHSSRGGGLMFTQDPAGYELRLRAIGYVDP